MPADYSPGLYNEDMAPTDAEHRTWGMWNIAALWVGMSVCIPTYMLAGSLIQQGLSWWEAVLCILAGNLVVLVPMLINGHAGTKYGIPFPVLLRTSYGHAGAHFPSILRALVACGWFGIQTWIGGVALHTMMVNLTGGAWPDTFTCTFVMYLLFWLMNVYFVWKGTESIKWLETWAAPFLLGIGLLLLGWGVTKGGGMQAVLARSNELARPVAVATSPSEGVVHVKFRVLAGADGQPKARSMRYAPLTSMEQDPTPSWGEWQPYDDTVELYGEGLAGIAVQFDNELADSDGQHSSVVKAAIGAGAQARKPRWLIYLISITAMVAFWATLALNIPDITRYAASQRDQAMGQALGLPLTMGLYSFIGLAVTCATLNIFPDLVIGADAIWDPVALLARFDSKAAVVLAMFMLAVATLTTNIAANVISPANCFSNAFPEHISFRAGGMIAAVLGVLMMPWKLLGQYIGWLVTYSGVLGPIIGVMVVDYLLIRKGELDVDALYTSGSQYAFSGGVNPAAVAATVVGVLVVASGWFVPDLKFLADGAWFSGAITAGVLYLVLCPRPPAAKAG